jgi:hypothetical protein
LILVAATVARSFFDTFGMYAALAAVNSVGMPRIDKR